MAVYLSAPGVGPGWLVGACGGLVSWGVIERRTALRLPIKVTRAIDLILVTAILVIAAAYLGSSESDLLMLGWILVASQFARALRRKQGADLAVMHGTALLQLALGAFLTRDVGFLVLLLAGILIGSVARQGALHQVVDVRGGVRIFVARPRGTARRRSIAGAVAGSLILTFSLVCIGAALFILLPRGLPFRQDEVETRNEVVDPTDYSKDRESSREAVAGFSERVVLGDVGKIKTTPWRAFFVRFAVRGVLSRLYDKDLYFRGLSFDTFNGSGWTRSRGLRAERRWLRTAGGPRPLLLYEPENAPRVPGRLIRQEYEMEPSKSSVLFGLDRLVSIDLMEELPRVLRLGDGAYAAARPHQDGFIYRVSSDPDRPLLLDELPPEDEKRFLSMPPAAEAIAELSRMVAGEGTEQIRRERLQNWLRENCSYTLSFRERVGSDALADFLFETRAGHCEYFASALAILLRAVKIPSRIVVGYRGGQWIESEQGYLVWQKDAHAWVEAWVNGRGWVRMDPTPGDPNAVRVEPARVPGLIVMAPPDEMGEHPLASVRDFGPEDRGRLLRGAAGAIAFVVREGFGFDRPDRGFPPPLLVLLLCTAVYAGGKWLLGVLPGRLRKTVRSRRPEILRRAIERGFYDEALRSLGAMGLSRRRSQSPREFLVEAGPHLGDAEARFRVITVAFERVRYADAVLAAEEIERLNHVARSLAPLEN